MDQVEPIVVKGLPDINNSPQLKFKSQATKLIEEILDDKDTNTISKPALLPVIDDVDSDDHSATSKSSKPIEIEKSVEV